MKSIFYVLNSFILISLLFCGAQLFAAETMTVERHDIALKGTASGGTLVLVGIGNRNARYFEIKTEPGESAQTVAEGLALAFNEANPFGWWGPKMFHAGGNPYLHADGGSIGNFPGTLGMYTLAGTEEGLGIPKPPLSLSCSYDSEKEQIALNWVNPPGEYDDIAIIVNGVGFISDEFSKEYRGTTLTKFFLNAKGRDISNVDFCVVGLRNGTPSNAAAIHLNNTIQCELFGIPFANGVAPNWSVWFEGGDASGVQFEQGTREGLISIGNPYNPITTPENKPFFQKIATKSPGVTAGVSRKFLGLTPGHTYRISAIVNTLQMDSAGGEWSYSLHAAYNGPEGTDLTPKQMSGLEKLPDGSEGAQAGRIANYGPKVTTQDKWERCSSGGESAGPGKEINDITLPSGVDTLTVWVRHNATENSGVGLLWVSLKDVTTK